MKITIERLKELENSLKTKRREEVAKEWGVCLATINYWVKQLKEKGVEVNNYKHKKLIDLL